MTKFDVISAACAICTQYPLPSITRAIAATLAIAPQVYISVDGYLADELDTLLGKTNVSDTLSSSKIGQWLYDHWDSIHTMPATGRTLSLLLMRGTQSWDEYTIARLVDIIRDYRQGVPSGT